MATTSDYINQLQMDKLMLAHYLSAQGVEATNDETFTSLVPKVATISKGTLQEKTVTPSKTNQEVIADENYYGLNKVTVNSIPDEYIIPSGTKDITENGIHNVKEYENTKVNVQPKLQDKEVTPTKEGFYVQPDYDYYYGLNSVLVKSIPDEYIVPSGTLYIIENGEYDVKEYKKASVNISGGSADFQITDARYLFCYGAKLDIIDKLLPLISPTCINYSYMFQFASDMTEVPYFNTTGATTVSNMFTSCKKLTTIPLFDFSNSNNFNSLFDSCTELLEIPQINTSSGKSFSRTFNSCTKLRAVPLIDTSEATTVTYLFANCKALTEIPAIDIGNATTTTYMFQNCTNLITVPMLDLSEANQVTNMFQNCTALTNLGGLKNLGQAYLTSSSANYSNYKLDLSACTLLTHDSLMNIINNLYDIKSKGCKTQTLVLGANNIAKLSSDEIAIATNKGFTIS